MRAIALTGSGREAAATVVRAAFPEAADRIVTLNEIVAHATAAIRCDERGGESMSVVEIGGQDAKFIQIEGGRIVESDMNKACSAGTGSFLEEQALFYGVDDIGEFTRLAMTASRPPDLGQMCTVFVADAAAEAHNEGFEVRDLFAGFQYSVIHNYINRVMGQRTFGQRIFFQGKPASGNVARLDARRGHGSRSGGAAQSRRDGRLGHRPVRDRRTRSRWRSRRRPASNSSSVLGAEVVGKNEFQCRDSRCATLCTIARTRVAVLGGEQTVLSGGACPKYEVASGARAKLPKEAPSAFDERQALLAPYLEERPGGRVIGVPMAGACFGLVPWLVEFVAGLGFGVRVLAPDGQSLSRGEERCYAYDACAPVKAAHGILDADVDTVFFPTVLSTDSEAGGCGRTCAMEQAQPEMAGAALRARGPERCDVVSPVLSFDAGTQSKAFAAELLAAARALLGAEPDRARVAAAGRAAAQAQARYDAALLEIGRRTLDYGTSAGLPVVPVCGPLHVIHDPVINAGIPRLLRENGVLAAADGLLPDPGQHASRAARAVVGRAPGAARRRSRPASGATSTRCCCRRSAAIPRRSESSSSPRCSRATRTRPSRATDTAARRATPRGFRPSCTRCDATTGGPRPRRRRGCGCSSRCRTSRSRRDDERQFVAPALGEPYAAVMAANFRAFGLDAVAPGPSDAERLRIGRRDCSGKECIPYQLFWGSFRRSPRAQRRRTQPRARAGDRTGRLPQLHVLGEGPALARTARPRRPRHDARHPGRAGPRSVVPRRARVCRRR